MNLSSQPSFEAPEPPLVSVVIPTYQRPDALRRAIASALNQTYPHTEIVVAVEDGDQSSVSVVEAMTHPRVRYVVNKGRRGPGPNRDSGISASLGKWIAFLDDDDEWLPEKLARQMETAGGNGQIIVSCQAYVVTDADSRILPLSAYDSAEPIDEWFFDRRHWFKARGSFAQTSTLLAPRALFDRVRFGESRHEDWELVIRAVKQEGFQLVTLMQPLVRYPAGGTYNWEDSLAWADQVRDLLSPRAYSGFVLTVAARELPRRGRNLWAIKLLTMAFRHGRPTAKQILAFTRLWAIPRT